MELPTLQGDTPSAMDRTFSNATAASSSSSPGRIFLLMGLPGLKSSSYWLAFPVCLTFLLSALGNGTILLLILLETSLHLPMYLFLGLLAACDLGLSTALLPTMLRVFLLGSQEIGEVACLSQLFFIHAFSIMESSVLLAMALDRFMAICHPLRYASIMTNSRVAHIGLAVVLRGLALHVPFPFLLRRLTFCHSSHLSYSYCLHPDIMKLACHKPTMDVVYGLLVVFSTMGLDPILIVLSYACILKTIMGISSLDERFKALHTCACHISVVLLFYTPMLALSLISRLKVHAPSLLHVLLSYLHFLAPPLINPILYCIKMKEVRKIIVAKVTGTRRDGWEG